MEDFWQVLSQKLHEKEMPIFAHLTEKEIHTFIEASRVIHYQAGNFIFKSREIGEEMFILLSGTVEVCNQNQKTLRKYVLSTFQEGQVFGKMVFLSQMSCTIDVVALTDIEAIIFS